MCITSLHIPSTQNHGRPANSRETQSNQKCAHIGYSGFRDPVHPAMDWIPSDFKKKRGRPGVSWTSTIKKDLDLLGLTWEEALDLTKDRSDWRDCTARCAFTVRGTTQVEDKVLGTQSESKSILLTINPICYCICQSVYHWT